MKTTRPTKTAEIIRNCHLINLKGQVLGRTATGIATLLIGKSKPYFKYNYFSPVPDLH